MTRELVVGAAQLGPITRADSREDVMRRLINLLGRGAEYGCELVVFPELALTTFFPRWYLDDGGPGGSAAIAGDTAELDSYYETEMPSPATKRLFD
ncbi:MAG: nitrilase-related carbon-nitrogen hydrolase, partial [Actinomycetota bacterium]